MSRVGGLPINVPKGIELSIGEKTISVKGKLGQLSQDLSDDISLVYSEDVLTVEKKSKTKEGNAKQGLYRALIANMVKGVSEGFSLELELVGVGYRATNQGQRLDLSLGYSHNIIIELAPEVKVETVSEKGKNPIVKLFSFDKQLLGQVAAKIRSFRKPEPYKGKGIRYVGEVLRKKEGKSA